MKAFKKIILLLAFFILVLPLKPKALDNTINLYLFYSSSCPHCAALERALVDIKEEYPNLKIYKYEISENAYNASLMVKAAKELSADSRYVPFTIIGTKTFIGYSETQTNSEIIYALKLYSSVSSYKDPIGQMLGVDYSKGTLTYENIKSTYEDKDENNDDGSYAIDVPFIGPVETKNLSLPIISVAIGAIDGFNPCAMWVLLFLISVLIGMKDRKRMWILGSSFLLTSAFVYLAFMLAWLNVAIFIGAIGWIKLLIAVVALAGGFLNLRAFVRTKENGCEVVNETKRTKIFTKIKNFTSEKNFLIALLGVITLAISVNFIELTCSAGLPVIFTNILALNHLSAFEYALYIFLYLLFFLLDDLIIFFIAMTSLKLTGISTKYGRYSHFIGGIIMIMIGILMIFKPEWLMFNF